MDETSKVELVALEEVIPVQVRAGVEQAAMSRFVHGWGLRVESLELIAEALGLEIVVRPRKRKG